jgi:L-ascorbate metabolism protein UlaG (beta-lactamase superfamily)
LYNKTGLFIVPLAVGADLEDAGVAREKIIELDWWDEYQVTERLMVAATPAQHFSGRGVADRNETLWASFVVKGPHHIIYYSGDSGYFDGFKMIGEKYGPFDIAIVESGAYDERWHHIHMFPEEAVQASIDLQSEILHPIHWATFNLALHSWYDPMQRLTTAADSLGIVAATPVVGETTVFGEYIPTDRWWEKLIVKE